jgi:hypothetical protein
MHCLDEDVARQLHVDDTGGAKRRCGQLWHGTIARVGSQSLSCGFSKIEILLRFTLVRQEFS